MSGLLNGLFPSLSRRRRLAAFGLAANDPLPVAKIRMRITCANPGCARFAVANTACAESYRTTSDPRFFAAFKKTAAVTDLSAFSSFEAYCQAVSKETTGKYRRSANKAKRAGYFTRQIAIGGYARSLFDIKRSKTVRSHGRMSELSGGPTRPQSDLAAPPTPPTCHEHWRIDWGLFNRADDTMWGFASVVRSGNLAHLDHMIGHADVLAGGGMKLMQFDIMSWLLNRQDSFVDGVDYLLHGAIEDGSEGMADWRRYVHQRPYLLTLERPERAELPRDFDPPAYLDINPDVRAARVDPRQHYLRHGILEGRAYRRERSSAGEPS
jgi:hypothetical protein